MKKKLFLCAVALMALCVSASAEPYKYAEKFVRFDNKIREFLMAGMDTTYVGVPASSFEVLLLNNSFGFDAKLQNGNMSDAGFGDEIDLGIGYHGLDLCFGIEVGPRKSVFNFAFDYFDNYWGLGINILNTDVPVGNNGDFYRNNVMVLNGYFAFNGSKFSYPASCYANYIQKKSAGSPIIAFRYDRRSFTPYSPAAADWLATDLFPFEPGQKLAVHRGSLTAGYSYNFAFLEGKILLNTTADAGMYFPLGIAANARVGGIFWINDHFRINVNAYAFTFTSMYKKDYYGKFVAYWRTQLGVAYCF